MEESVGEGKDCDEHISKAGLVGGLWYRLSP
jgi:hypothetical protein